MSNKSRLQTNNNNLQALINKANSLPDAGGGGGSTDTCTVTLRVGGGTCYYTDGNTLELTTTSTGNATITIPINSILAFTSWNSMVRASGSYSLIFYNQRYAAYYISGDCSFNFSDEPV